MDNVAQKLMDIARWYSMPADHFNTIKKAVELLNRPRCSLKKCPFLDGAHGRTAHGGGRMSDLIERQAILDGLEKYHENTDLQYIDGLTYAYDLVCKLPSVSTEKTGRCKDCKYFEYDSFEKINGMQLIVAHEICSKWADGCKTREDGYCFLFEPKTQEVEE